MLDVDTQELLAVAENALTAPAHLTSAQLAEWHAHTLRHRLPLIQEALRGAREHGDAEVAMQLIDQAIHDHPTTTVTAVAGSVLHLSTTDQGLPIPEHVLCALLYKHWAMTVEGAPPHEVYVARRPLGWTGDGDPYERITAPDRTELLRLLAHRHLGVHQRGPEPPTAA